MSDRLDPMPEHAEARSIYGDGWARCGKCRGQLQHVDQVRCPYVGCRTWLKGTSDPDVGARGSRKRKDHA